jgi:hypothetical protein
LITQKQCIDEAKRCLEGNDDVRLRNSARALADFARITFGEITRYYPMYLTTRNLQIGPRYRTLVAIVPELSRHKKMFDEIERLRQMADHSDDLVPKESELTDLISKADKFQVEYETKILPRLKAIVTPKQQLKEEWKSIPPLIEELKQYTQWSFAEYSVFEPEVKEIENIINNIDTIDDFTINNYRIKVRDLQNRMAAALEAAEQGLQWTAAEAEYDQWRGK